MQLKDCYRAEDFRKLAKRRLPAPIFHYIDGGSDDEVTLARNTSAFDSVDLVPNVLAGVDDQGLRHGTPRSPSAAAGRGLRAGGGTP